jgi:hypothetical protein
VLDGRWRPRLDLPRHDAHWLLDLRDRVGRDQLLSDRHRQDRLQHRQGATHGRLADAVAQQLGSIARDHLRSDLSHPVPA